jgi:hypothetical protein
MCKFEDLKMNLRINKVTNKKKMADLINHQIFKFSNHQIFKLT